MGAPCARQRGQAEACPGEQEKDRAVVQKKEGGVFAPQHEGALHGQRKGQFSLKEGVQAVQGKGDAQAGGGQPIAERTGRRIACRTRRDGRLQEGSTSGRRRRVWFLRRARP